MDEVEYGKARVIAEIGCNHKGDMEIAKELILLAKEAGADVAKFQKRNPKELLTEEQYNAPHPNPDNSYGKTYGEHREFLELDKGQHEELKDFCESNNIEYSTSVWDVTSTKEMIGLKPKMLKVPSASNNNKELLRLLRDEYGGEVHLSFGMTSKAEEKEIVGFFEETGAAKDRLVIYACTSGYPVPPEDICLLEIKRLYKEYGSRVKAIGFSGHHLGTAIDIAAYSLGAKWIERHFTKDKNSKGTDHGASLEPDEMMELVDNLGIVHNALQYKKEDILDIEKVQRKKLKSR